MDSRRALQDFLVHCFALSLRYPQPFRLPPNSPVVHLLGIAKLQAFVHTVILHVNFFCRPGMISLFSATLHLPLVIFMEKDESFLSNGLLPLFACLLPLVGGNDTRCETRHISSSFLLGPVCIVPPLGDVLTKESVDCIGHSPLILPCKLQLLLPGLVPSILLLLLLLFCFFLAFGELVRMHTVQLVNSVVKELATVGGTSRRNCLTRHRSVDVKGLGRWISAAFARHRACGHCALLRAASGQWAEGVDFKVIAVRGGR
mmetsp:Transcript_37939/g.95263  ORF Transcript_37939/g.95263 Transcript_37939/m.95263 type:complete len:259 (+) Transcript_37939:1845-2621(+)